VVTVADKREVIEYLFFHVTVSMRTLGILEYLRKASDEKIEGIVFIDHDIEKVPQGIKITEGGVSMYYVHGFATSELRNAYNALMEADKDSPFFFQIPVDGFTEDAIQLNPHSTSSYTASSICDEFLDSCKRDAERLRTLAKIDEALDNNDKQAFLALTDLLKTLSESPGDNIQIISEKEKCIDSGR
jgi:uncharacterized protein YpiB (UPF0302 family)